jgi:hypothetical protein
MAQRAGRGRDWRQRHTPNPEAWLIAVNALDTYPPARERPSAAWLVGAALPCPAAACRIGSISWSLICGMIGAARTRTGTLAAARALTVATRLAAVVALGSITRARSLSKVVMLMATEHKLRRAIDERISRSRSTRDGFVTMVSG